MHYHNFDIKPGKYHVPGIGKVNTNDGVDGQTALRLYLKPRGVFPFISLNENSINFLGKQKFKAVEVGKMIANATTSEEAKQLAELSETKTVSEALEMKLGELLNK